MSITTLLVIILVIFLIGGLPNWGYHERGYYPSGGAGLILLIIVILFLMGRL